MTKVPFKKKKYSGGLASTSLIILGFLVLGLAAILNSLPKKQEIRKRAERLCSWEAHTPLSFGDEESCPTNGQFPVYLGGECSTDGQTEMCQQQRDCNPGAMYESVSCFCRCRTVTPTLTPSGTMCGDTVCPTGYVCINSMCMAPTPTSGGRSCSVSYNKFRETLTFSWQGLAEGKKTRLWVQNPSYSEIPNFRPTAKREYLNYEGISKIVAYILSEKKNESGDNASGSETIDVSDLPPGEYYAHCDFPDSQPLCSGNPLCNYERNQNEGFPPGGIPCEQGGPYQSCSSNDNTRFVLGNPKSCSLSRSGNQVTVSWSNLEVGDSIIVNILEKNNHQVDSSFVKRTLDGRDIYLKDIPNVNEQINDPNRLNASKTFTIPNDLPEGEYFIQCGISSSNQKCSGNPLCYYEQEPNAGTTKFWCTSWRSCSDSDHLKIDIGAPFISNTLIVEFVDTFGETTIVPVSPGLTSTPGANSCSVSYNSTTHELSWTWSGVDPGTQENPGERTRLYLVNPQRGKIPALVPPASPQPGDERSEGCYFLDESGNFDTNCDHKNPTITPPPGKTGPYYYYGIASSSDFSGTRSVDLDNFNLPPGEYYAHCDIYKHSGTDNCSGNPYCDYEKNQTTGFPPGGMNCTGSNPSRPLWVSCSNNDNLKLVLGTPKSCSVSLSGKTVTLTWQNLTTATGAEDKARLWLAQKDASRIQDLATRQGVRQEFCLDKTNEAGCTSSTAPTNKQFYYQLLEETGTSGTKTFDLSTLNLPQGEYYLSCDVNSKEQRCSGNPFCNYEKPEGDAPGGLWCRSWRSCSLDSTNKDHLYLDLREETQPGTSDKKARFILYPSTGTFLINQEFSIDIKIDTAGEPIIGARLKMSYPADLLERKGVTKGNLFMWFDQIDKYDDVNGIIDIIGVTSSARTGPDVQFLTIKFRVKAAGRASFTYLSESMINKKAEDKPNILNLSLCDRGNYTLVTEEEVAEMSNVTLRVNFIRITSQPRNPPGLNYQEQPIKVKFISKGSNPPFIPGNPLIFRAITQGNKFYYENKDPIVVLPGRYDIYLKGPRHLQKRFKNVEMTKGTAVIDLTKDEDNLLGGDLPLPTTENKQDGRVNSLDYGFLVSNRNSTDPDILVIGDINLDGQINSGDTAIVTNALAERLDEDE